MLIKQAKDKGLNLGAAIEAARAFQTRQGAARCPGDGLSDSRSSARGRSSGATVFT